jgi:uncharacterized damage-inducible protein DinB
MTIGRTYLDSVIKRFREYRGLGEKTFAQIGDADMHLQPNESSNSIAMIIQHMHGNMLSRWTNFLTEDGEKPWRKREEEFEAKNLSKEELLKLWNEGWELFLATLDSLTEDDLLKTITIRTQPLIAVDALNRQLAHYGYHVGQIVYLGRWAIDRNWKSLSIPKGGTQQFNEDMKQSRH